MKLAEYEYSPIERAVVRALGEDFLDEGLDVAELVTRLARFRVAATADEVRAALVVLETLGRVVVADDDTTRLR